MDGKTVEGHFEENCFFDKTFLSGPLILGQIQLQSIPVVDH